MRIKSWIYESGTEFWGSSKLTDEQFLHVPFLTTEFAGIMQNKALRRSRSFKVVDFRTNRKLICDFDFLLAIY